MKWQKEPSSAVIIFASHEKSCCWRLQGHCSRSQDNLPNIPNTSQPPPTYRTFGLTFLGVDDKLSSEIAAIAFSP
jgi:hypothetical protein